jgi:glyoxylase-like metal-dependent hydrolase (beta-lactamase superfamily II)
MAPAPDRREFLRILVAGTGLSAASLLPGGTFAAGLPLTVTDVGRDLTLIAGAGGNVVVFDGPDGLVVVNGGSRDRSADLLAAMATRFAGRRVTTLFNTDWHPEHTGSNETVAAAGARIVAHEHTRQYLGEELFVEWSGKTFKPLPRAARPTHTFYSSETLTVGDERIEYGHLGQAHTDGDAYVYFRTRNVLAAGDALSVGAYPICDYTTGGWIGGLINATKKLIDLVNDETRVLPGSGPVQTRGDLQAQHDMLQAMRDRLTKMMRQGMGPEDMLAAAPSKEFDAKWGDPKLFVTTTYRGLWLHVRELGGVV